VAGEFDGIDKYLKPEFLKGRTAAQAVVEEKLREDRIRATGAGVVRTEASGGRRAPAPSARSPMTRGMPDAAGNPCARDIWRVGKEAAS
jgi:hypothetical protein